MGNCACRFGGRAKRWRSVVSRRLVSDVPRAAPPKSEYFWATPTIRTAPTAFPAATTPMFAAASIAENSAPRDMAIGRRNMFATECSKLSAMKVMMGNQRAAILPGAVGGRPLGRRPN